ncbi:MAG: antibiotic biosynthesis monooxygenase [Acidimicrobiia bacterium]|nr:antibiotic biosynthesis monooxygenase [Acidimicrobiia bacterium]
MSKIAVLAKLTTVDGKRDDAVSAFAPMFDHVRANEAGTLVYALHKDQNDANVLWFYELYDGQDSLTAHSGSDTMKSLQLKGLLAGRPELTMLDPAAAKGLDF